MNAVPTLTQFQAPGRRDEAWRYSDLRRVLRDLPEVSPPLSEAVSKGGLFSELAEPELVVGNGRLNWWPERNFAGVRFFQHETPDAPARAAQAPLAALAAERAIDAVQIIEVSGEIPRSVQLRWVTDARGTAHYARVGLVVRAGATASLLETVEGSGEGYFADYLLEIFLEPGATLNRVTVLSEPASAISVLTSDVRPEAGASYSHTVITSGARLQRNETWVDHPGHGASVRLDGLYVLNGERHADLTSVVTHGGVGGETRQLTKGVVSDRARGVFQGRIVVAHGADKTDARMGHHALILGDLAEIDAKPELEIYADDVACAHGNTIGALDDDALFYAMSRGVPEPEARAMLTAAFLGEVLDRIEDERVREIAQAWLEGLLHG